ncbi:MAG: hypothetical protein JWN25_1390 [Verrucomicrobiales bacterium]|nr:hypothetical protein [Verrucomicrobiales bacterium]
MNTKKQNTKFLHYFPSRESVHLTKVITQKMSPCVTGDKPVLLGKCHFPVTFLSISKRDIRSAWRHPLPHSWEVEPRLEPRPKFASSLIGKCPKRVLKMSVLQKTRCRVIKSQSQPASVVKIRRMRGDENLIKKIKRPVQDEHKKAVHTMALSFLHSGESVQPTKVITQKMSPSVTGDKPVLLGKCHFPVTFLSISKRDIRSVSSHRLPTKMAVEPRLDLDQNLQQFPTLKTCSLDGRARLLGGGDILVCLDGRVLPAKRKRSPALKSRVLLFGKCPKPVLKMSFLKKKNGHKLTGQASLHNRLQPASVVKLVGYEVTSI